MFTPDQPEIKSDKRGLHKDFISQIVYFPIIIYMRLLRQLLIENLKQPQKVYNASLLADNYDTIVGYMDAICTAKNIRFYSVLQPFNGAGNRILTEQDKNLLKVKKGQLLNNKKSRFDFFLEYYEAIRQKMGNYSFFYDFTEVFDNEKGQIFSDTVHFSDKGQKIIADTLCKIIRRGERR